MKLFYKHVRNHDQARGQRTLNEKYEMYLNSMRSIINTHIHLSPQIITKFKQYIIIWMWVGQLQFIHLVHKHSVVAIIILMPSEQDFVTH